VGDRTIGIGQGHGGRLTRRGFLGAAAVGGLLPLTRHIGIGTAFAAAAKRGGTLQAGIANDLVSLDPNDIVFANVPMFFQVYDYLVKWSDTIRPRPGLAETWDLAKDGTSAVFRLRAGVRTHSGGTFNADSLIANFHRVKTQATGGGLYSILQDWQTADRLDDRTVRFHFSRPHPDYLYQISRWGMIDPASFATVKNRGGGTGPFKVKEWIPGDHVTFEKFDGYWEPGIPLLDQVVCRVMTDPLAMENALQAGTIDFAHTVPNKDAARLRGAGLRVIPAPVANEFYVLTLNTRHAPLDNLKLRQAIALLVDRKTIVQTILGGVGGPIAQFVSPASPGYARDIETEYAYNPTKAKALLAQSGVGRLRALNFLTSTNESLAQIAQVIQANLREAGIEASLNIKEPSQYFPPYFKGDFDLNLSFLTLATLDPTGFTISSAFRTNPTNPSWLEVGPPQEYIQGIDSLNATLNQQERWSRVRSVVRFVLSQAWVVPVALHLPTYGLTKAVEGFAADPQYLIELYGVWLNR
jgi:peptide/nickel transport system substrate-binding protein